MAEPSARHLRRALLADGRAEARQRIIEIYGVDRYMHAVGMVVDSDLDGAGRTRRLWDAPRLGDSVIVAVEVTNATPEPDGSHARHWLRVPPEIRTCQAAVAWTFGLPPETYVDLIET